MADQHKDQDQTTGEQADTAMLAALPPAGAWLQDHGLVLDHVSGSSVTAHLDLDARHLTPWGVVHGGVYTTAVETIASIGASIAVHPRGEFAVGVNNTTDFIRASSGGRADITGEPVVQGRVQQLWHVRITRHGDGKLLAEGRVRLQNVPLRPPDG